jgi:hypothetical protein
VHHPRTGFAGGWLYGDSRFEVSQQQQDHRPTVEQVLKRRETESLSPTTTKTRPDSFDPAATPHAATAEHALVFNTSFTG